MKNFIFRITIIVCVILGLLFLNGSMSSSSDNNVECKSSSNSKELSEDCINSAEDIELDVMSEFEKDLDKFEYDDVLNQKDDNDTNSFSFNDREESNNTNEQIKSSESVNLDSEVDETIKEPRIIQGRDVLSLLSNSKVTSTEGYYEKSGRESASVFAEDVTDCFLFWTAVTYNMFSHNIQSVVYTPKKLLQEGNVLVFDIGVASGGRGVVNVDIYTDNSDTPVIELSLDAEEPPQHVEINLENSQVIKIVCNNTSNSENTVVAYNLVLRRDLYVED